MIRTVPHTGSEEIELYMRTYYSLLRSSDVIKMQALVESHMAIDSSLHVHARDESQIDVSALVYSTLRVPDCIGQIKVIVLGQLQEDFARAGYRQVERWPLVYAPGRRRRTHFDGKHTLAVMIASRSDIDDLIPILVALQIEWNKIHLALCTEPGLLAMLNGETHDDRLTPAHLDQLAGALNLTPEEINRLQSAWKGRFLTYFQEMADHRMDLGLQLLAGSQVNYRKAVNRWWENLEDVCGANGQLLRERPVYFVSSNTHSIANLVSGFARQIHQDLIRFMDNTRNRDLQAEWAALQAEPDSPNRENFYYYLLKKFQTEYPASVEQMVEAELGSGLARIPAEHGFDIEGQVLDLSKLDPARLDRRLRDGLNAAALAESDALVINIDYPLGLAAFELLTRVAEGCGQILGLYVMGKAATLNGRIGDVMLVNVVHDEHSKNTYLFDNCFHAPQLWPYLAYGTLLDNQKAITARGTFLQNRTYMDVFYREGYTVLEMEAGPYLSAVYEMMRPVRHPSDEIVNLYPARFDVGIIHYASDTPYSRGHNLGAGSLGYRGMDATYACAVAILRRIFEQEARRLSPRIEAAQPSWATP